MSGHSYSLRRRLLLWLLVALLAIGALASFDTWREAVATSNTVSDRVLAGSVLAIAERVIDTEDGALEVDVPYVALEMLTSAAQDRVFYRVDGPAGFITGYQNLPTAPGSSELAFSDASFRGEPIRLAVLQRAAVLLGSGDQALGEGARLDQRRCLRRAEPARERHRFGQPGALARTARGAVFDGIAAVGVETPITPRIAERVGKLGMQREAPPRQPVEWAAAAPVQRQKSARFARGRTGDCVTFDDDGLGATPTEEVGGRSANRAAAADDDASGSAHALTVAARQASA